MRNSLYALALALLLALPTPLRAAEAVPDDAGRGAEGPQDPAFGPKRKASGKDSVPFPGPTAEQLSKSGGRKAEQPAPGQAGTQPGGAQGPKSTKPMYGDIVIHK